MPDAYRDPDVPRRGGGAQDRDRAGHDLATLVEVIRASSGNTWLTENWEQARAFLRLLLADPAQLESLVATGRKDLELARAFCTEAGLAAPLLEQALATLDAPGVAALRGNLAAIVAAEPTAAPRG